ncbi:nuclear transport factor 2 family protein [Allorhizocola rhizosphaerae]|uniref:nuclear transport factor 2 family protein n=1 Tax=Allorhizocola rhizosphaerae TaxID=1872709 RepID=UPI000E3B56BF|nr:nuclear transport factor 2 family protein [Allorhizocola rhizosphaerae]
MIGRRRSPPTAAITAAGIDHVRLSYEYLDAGDIDGYASLLDEHVQVKRPDAPHGHGRAEVLRLHANIATPACKHEIYKIIADGDCVAAVGRFTGHIEAEFVDVFTLSDEGLLAGYRRFYFANPN